MRFEFPCEHDSRETTAGVEVPGFYDGILFWACEVCGRIWHRWPMMPDAYSVKMRKLAIVAMQTWERARHADAEQGGEAGQDCPASAASDVPELGR